MASKYQAQIDNLRKNYARFSLDLKPDVLKAFRDACARNGTTATTELKKFIKQYCEENAVSDEENAVSDSEQNM